MKKFPECWAKRIIDGMQEECGCSQSIFFVHVLFSSCIADVEFLNLV